MALAVAQAAVPTLAVAQAAGLKGKLFESGFEGYY